VRQPRNPWQRTMAAALALAAWMAVASLAALGAPPAGRTADPVAGPAAGPAVPPAAPASAAGPRIVVLGTVQDGGMPQVGCDCSHCTAARRDPALARRVASLAIDFPKSGHTYLVDAGPDLAAQIEEVHGFRQHPAGRVDRAPFDGVLLTHAHIGHYLGLAFFGFEAIHTQKLPVYASPRMAAYLRGNGPWSQLVRLDNIALTEIAAGTPFSLEDGVTVQAFAVPHRDEYSDTLAFVIRGPHRTVLYVPDTDGWGSWAKPLPEILDQERVDVALLDGTFYSLDELPGRAVEKIGHPLITATLDLLGPRVKAGKLRVLFTHLNHSNPALSPESAARKEIERRGFGVAADGLEIGL
jgi:pyrroloquinoline quinone biosynthesis protein B